MKRNQDTAMSQPITLYPISLSMLGGLPTPNPGKNPTMRELLVGFGSTSK